MTCAGASLSRGDYWLPFLWPWVKLSFCIGDCTDKDIDYKSWEFSIVWHEVQHDLFSPIDFCVWYFTSLVTQNWLQLVEIYDFWTSLLVNQSDENIDYNQQAFKISQLSVIRCCLKVFVKMIFCGSCISLSLNLTLLLIFACWLLTNLEFKWRLCSWNIRF